MEAKKIFVRVDEIKRQFYHKYHEQQFRLDHYQSVAAALTAWLEEHQPDALGGFWTGELNPPSELTDITEITEMGIIYFGQPAGESAGQSEEAEAGVDNPDNKGQTE